jgi:hypothetical protein
VAWPKAVPITGIPFAGDLGSRPIIRLIAGNAESAWTGGNGIARSAINALMGYLFLVRGAAASVVFTI